MIFPEPVGESSTSVKYGIGGGGGHVGYTRYIDYYLRTGRIADWIFAGLCIFDIYLIHHLITNSYSVSLPPPISHQSLGPTSPPRSQKASRRWTSSRRPSRPGTRTTRRWTRPAPPRPCNRRPSTPRGSTSPPRRRAPRPSPSPARRCRRKGRASRGRPRCGPPRRRSSRTSRGRFRRRRTRARRGSGARRG